MTRFLRSLWLWFSLFLTIGLVFSVLRADPPAPPKTPAPVGIRSALADALLQHKEALPANDWQATPFPWTPDMVRQVAELLGSKERADQVLRSWADGAALVWTSKRDPNRQVSVGTVRFADAAGARAYCGLALDLQRKQDEWIVKSSNGTRQILESRVQSLALANTDEALRCDKKVQLMPGQPTSITTLWVRAGELVVECCWRDVAADPSLAEKLTAALRADLVRPR